MVENNEFNKGRRRYNSHRGGYRRGGNHGSNVSVGSRGILNFLFSFNGKISRNLVVGFGFFLGIIYSIVGCANALIKNPSIDYAFSFVAIILFIIDVAVNCKRAHALGISGIYSVFGFVCAPFFYFNRSDRDFANDNVYKPRFNFFKKFGAFVNRNVFTQIVYLVFFFVIMFAPLLCKPDFSDRDAVIDAVKTFGVSVVSLVVFNLAQMLLLRMRWFRYHYVGFVKTATFVAYNMVVMLIASGITLLLLMSSLMK